MSSTGRRREEERVPATTAEMTEAARRARRHIVRCSALRPVHLGASLSVTDVLTALYFGAADTRPGPRRDRVILSKGHAALALYAVLVEHGDLSAALLDRIASPDNELGGHPPEHLPGIDHATGALGHGLSVGAGLALAAARGAPVGTTFVVLGDGELNEGTVWEAAMFASHHRLDRLVAIVDCNGYQQEGETRAILDLAPLRSKWEQFGWTVDSCDGHDVAQLTERLSEARDARQGPTVLIAATHKGKGISFTEDDPKWHFGSLEGELLERALDELGEGARV